MVKIRVAKRNSIENWKALSIRFGSVIAAFIVAALFIMAMGHNPIEVYSSMLIGGLGSEYAIKETIIKSVPLLIAGLGIAIAFKMKFWNIGAEGQLVMGAFGASFIALNFGNVPKFILIPLMALAAIICGGFWAMIPAFFKAKFKTNETIFTLMLNYIAIKWVTYLQYGPWKDPNAMGFPKIAGFSDNAVLPKVFGVHIGVYAALLLAVIIYIFIKHTKRGYEISVIGESEKTAEYAGMNVSKIIISTIFLSGAICALAGMIQVSGVSKTLEVGIASGNGFTAIIIAWLSNLNPVVMVIISFLFAAMVQGSQYIQMAFGIPQSAAYILQGMILFFILGAQFFINYRLYFTFGKGGEKNGN